MTIIEDIKERLDIVKVIEGYLPLTKRGKNFVAPCPFHQESTPSFYVSPDRQRWRCFGACACGGDLLDFVVKKEGLTGTLDAIKILAPMAGIELADHRNQKWDRLYAILVCATDYYHDNLRNVQAGGKAREYLKGRGLTTDTLKAWRIGFAPLVFDGLIRHLHKNGFTRDEIMEAGLGYIQPTHGKLIDRFLNRIIIPITDSSGRVIGFGGRTLEPDVNPKYLNSPETPLFNKSSVLFGLAQSISSIRQQKYAVIVEGYLDVITAHQAGFTNVVAQMGTALTDKQAKALSKYTQNVVLALDTDKAGQQATARGINIAASYAVTEGATLNLRIAAMTGGKDPDELIRHDPASFAEAIESSLSAVDFMIERGKAELGDKASFKDRENLAHSLLPVLISGSRLAAEDNIRRVANGLGLSEDGLIEWVKEQRRGVHKPTEPSTPPDDKDNPIERALIASLCKDVGSLAKVRRNFRLLSQHLSSPLMIRANDIENWQYRTIFEVIEQAFDQPSVDVWYTDYLAVNLPDDLYNLYLSLQRESELTQTDAVVVQAMRIKLAALQRDCNEIHGVKDMAPQFAQNMQGISALSLALRP